MRVAPSQGAVAESIRRRQFMLHRQKVSLLCLLRLLTPSQAKRAGEGTRARDPQSAGVLKRPSVMRNGRAVYGRPSTRIPLSNRFVDTSSHPTDRSREKTHRPKASRARGRSQDRSCESNAQDRLHESKAQDRTGDSQVKKCAFWCGMTNTDADIENPSQQLRWAYNDGKGMACWYCNRVYQVKKAHAVDSRAAYQNTLAVDKDEHERFHGWRANFLQRRKEGRHQGNRREDGVKKKTLKPRQSYGIKLLPPDDDFLPMADYKERFGSPSAAENRKNKHKKRVVAGILGVAIPGENLGRAWRLRREHADTTILDEVYEDGSEDDDVSSNQADSKFEQMTTEAKHNYEAAVGGVTLAQLIANITEGNQELKQGTSSKSTLLEQSAGDHEVKKQKRKRRGGFADAESSEDRRRHKKAASSGGTGRLDMTKAKVKASGGGKERAAAPQATPEKRKTQGGGKVGVAASPKTLEDLDKAGPGRKAKPLSEICAQQEELFRIGSADTLHFGEQRHTAIRCLRRYIATANTHLASASDGSQQQVVEVEKKTS